MTVMWSNGFLSNILTALLQILLRGLMVAAAAWDQDVTQYLKKEKKIIECIKYRQHEMVNNL